ncbi:uncharacterized protein LOC115758038 [Drosophila novamexicana]|uniref:uncharacterized protein LOC115758038 n=1 Tax=Drosophila novamexicana TaxID=47314 RepID=UPI0011E58FE8|nr:uncharacterized protein LOC115758038 [Drosophila novamexicana]
MQPALVMQSLQETQSFLAECDVTRQRTDVKSGTGPSAAISMETNVQPNRQQQRIYTSTPINEFKKQHKSQQRNDAIGFLDLAKATTKRYIRVGGGGAASVKGQEPTFDVRLKALILLFGIIIIGYRIITLTMPYINGSNVQQLSSYVQAQLSAALDWSEQHQMRSKLNPLLWGLIVSVFCYAIVYLDSAVPGVVPPAPFSSRSKQRSRLRSSAVQLNYWCALGAGIMVTFLMYVDV